MEKEVCDPKCKPAALGSGNRQPNPYGLGSPRIRADLHVDVQAQSGALIGTQQVVAMSNQSP